MQSPPSAAAPSASLSAWLETASTWLDRYPPLTAALGVLGTLVVALLALAVARRLLLPAITAMTRSTATCWDDLLIEHRVFHRFSWAVPWLVVHQLAPHVPHLSEGWTGLLQRLSLAALVVICLRGLGAMVDAFDAIYRQYPMARQRPIKGYLQVVLIVAWVFGAVIFIAMLMDRSPWLMLSGLGAMTAVLMLVFRDTILSLVAGVQLTTNDLIRVGDWIEMPQFGADGDVIDLGLHAVSVQNWDRTISVIPTHRFLEHSFKNWRGMSESGGRRIKRAFHVDMSSIRFLEPEEIERFGRYALLRDYIAGKVAELEAYNRGHAADPSLVSNARRLTNVGTLRAWIVAYLRQHPSVRQDMTFLIRQLEPTTEGLPIEIYVFCNSIEWPVYESIQSDIFDYVLTMVPEFGLRVFQNPSGRDLAGLAQSRSVGSEATGTSRSRAPVSTSTVVQASPVPGPGSKATEAIPRNEVTGAHPPGLQPRANPKT